MDIALCEEVSVKTVKELVREAWGRGINFAVTLLNNTLYRKNPLTLTRYLAEQRLQDQTCIVQLLGLVRFFIIYT